MPRGLFYVRPLPLRAIPRGQLVECGSIWKKQNKETGADYFILTFRDFAFNANLEIAASQDDASLQAFIPWGPKKAA